MATSVPQVRSIEDLKWACAGLLELGVEATKLSGDISYLQFAMKPIRELYESCLKTEANLGRLDRGYLEDVRKAIEKIEGVIERHKPRK